MKHHKLDTAIFSSINYQHCVNKDDLRLFLTYALVFLIIYGAMIVKQGYGLDELSMIDAAEPYSVHIAGGRCFFALWRFLVGANPSPVTFGLISSIFVSLGIIILTRVLNIKTALEKVIFGIIYLIQFQFAYMMEFSFQFDVVSFGFVLVAFSTLMIQKERSLCFFVSVIFLTIALTIYQSLIINFSIILLSLLYKTSSIMDWKATKKLALKYILCCIFSLLLYHFANKLVIALTNVDSNLIDLVAQYQSQLNVAKTIGFGNINGLIGQAIYTTKKFAMNMIYPHSYQGEWIYMLSYIPLFVLSLSTFKQKEATFTEKTFILSTIIGIWLLPFILMIVFLNPDAMPPRVRTGEPVALACMWALAIPQIRWTRVKGFFFVSILTFLVIKASYYVSEIAIFQRQRFEARLYAYKIIEFEAAKRASEAKVSINRQNILLFCFEDDKFVSYTPILRYPALVYVNNSLQDNKQLYIDHKEVIDCMPCWPADGSMKVLDDKIFVKLDSSCYRTQKEIIQKM